MPNDPKIKVDDLPKAEDELARKSKKELGESELAEEELAKVAGGVRAASHRARLSDPDSGEEAV